MTIDTVVDVKAREERRHRQAEGVRSLERASLLDGLYELLGFLGHQGERTTQDSQNIHTKIIFNGVFPRTLMYASKRLSSCY